VFYLVCEPLYLFYLIPLTAKHRVENVGEDTLIFIEVQTGTYFGEDDIVRIEDDYSRS
jgi:mannose-6-phosphate isomerase